MTVSVRSQWILSIHECEDVYNPMLEPTNLTLSTCEQHIEMGTTRRKRDFKDFNLFLHWLNHHDPFETFNEQLKSLSQV